MDSQTRIGLELTGAALLLGVLGDQMLRVTPWGLNALVWIGGLVVISGGLVYRWRATLVRAERWLLLPVCALALLYLGRDAALLKLINTVAVLTVLAMGIQRAQTARLRHHGISPFEPPGLLATSLKSILSLPRFLTRGVDWKSLSTEGRGQKAAAVGRGLLLAVPILLTFGGLLMAADAVFESLVARTFTIDPARLPGHLLLTILFAWIAGGFLYGVLMNVGKPPVTEDGAPDEKRRFSLGMVEVGVVLGLVNGLFATFVLVQLSYLFGGYTTVLSTADLTLAQYARRGFFELVTVAALALPLLMGLRRGLVVKNVQHLRLFHQLAGVHVVLLFPILASAAQRMWLYQQAYGLTELRLYVSAGIVWLAFVLAWFMGSVLRERPERFVPGTVAAGFILVLGLHVLNPDALIVKTNMARAVEGKPFDARYTTNLSADAVPALLDALPSLAPEDQADVARWLLTRWHTPASGPETWRTWNRARSAARRAVEANATILRRIAAETRQHPDPPSAEATPAAPS